MRLLVHGATGRIGGAVVTEALDRGHAVTAVVRDPGRPVDARAAVRVADILDDGGLAAVWAGHDAVVSALGRPAGGPPDLLARAAAALLAALRTHRVPLLVVGGAGTLEVEPGVRFLDSPGFPAERRPHSLAQAAALRVLEQAGDDLPWTYLAPPAVIAPGERTGRYRLGTDRMPRDADGLGRISVADFAVAVVDLLEDPAGPRGRRTVAY